DGSNGTTFQTTLPSAIILTIANDCGSATDTVIIIEDTNGPQLDLGADVIACEGDIVTLDAGISGVEYLWHTSTGSVSTDPELIVTISGIYYLQVSNACGTDSDTIVVDIHGTIPTPSLGADTSLCEGEVLLLISDADVETSVVWQDGSVLSEFVVSQAGTYSLTETNHCGSGVDTIVISYEAGPEAFDLGEDVVLCSGDSILLIAPATTDLITWQDGSHGASIVADQEQVYSLQIANDCGVSRDEVFVSFDPDVPVVDLKPSLSICPDQSVTLDVTQTFDANYLWNTGSTLPTIIITQPDVYAVTVFTDCYIETDDILIEADDDCEYEIFIPNVFSPNGDGVNDEWMVLLDDLNVIGIECRIFDRWGDLVYKDDATPISWSGEFNGKLMMPGVYVYVLTLESVSGEERIMSGDLTLIR
ncbi:MAG TPA: gliding motility-associated C-terminal domain-containing protein, partial [Saprospiraceae bacterium]|nr:gliding motility-associated C-terminal domain-containing protein [Saprospiraceae bacterium]